MKNIKKLKLKQVLSRFPAYFIVIFALFIAGSFSFILSQNQNTKEPQVSEAFENEKNQKPTAKKEKTQENQTDKNLIQQQTPGQYENPNNSVESVSTSTQTNTYVSTSTSTSSQTSQDSTGPNEDIVNNKVNLSLKGGSNFEVNIPNGANQCDVLTMALEQGKILSLNMRYDNSIKSNAVYQINGIGKENSVWWVYKVNGESPSQGCSYTGADNGDNVLWEYIGQ